MIKVPASTATATVTDYRKEIDGKVNPQYSKEVKVSYDIPEFEVVSTLAEVNTEFSEKQLIGLAQSRQKATANSAARQKAVALYALDPNSDEALRESMITDYIKLRLSKEPNKDKAREIATQHVDTLLSA